MELRAVLELLRSTSDVPLRIQADSQYVIKVFTEWLPSWRMRGMRTSGKKAVENQDLILEIDDLLKQRDVEWEWVRGHVGHSLNERADSLARFAAERSKQLRDTGSVTARADDPPRQRAV
jgi:ribonuclease HI